MPRGLTSFHRNLTLASMVTAAIGAWLICGASAIAADLPDPASLGRALDAPAQPIQVVEPHLTTRDRKTIVEYLGWPAEPVLDHLFGETWRAPGHEIEFRALDGYVSRIPSERFRKYRAYLVHDRANHGDFQVDNLAQNETNVPLGPYYLVWDNIRNPDLLIEGATFWPYQIDKVKISKARLAALLPGRLADRYSEEAALAQKYCLSCHKINGYGGDKWPVDFAQRVETMTARDFERWVLTPSAVKPGTTMPPFRTQLPEHERVALARRLFDYLVAVSTPSQ